MVTQLQDVSNTVAQEKISNQRLRNEEIRRQMANPWTAPQETTSTQGTQPLQNVTKGTPTLASTYSGLLNNYRSLTGTSGNSSRTEGNRFDGSYSGNPNPWGIPSWGPWAVGTGLNFAGAGIGAPIGAAFTSLMRGDRAGAAGTLAGLFTNVITEGKVPGLAGLASTLASGLVGDKSANEIGQGLVNSGIGTALSLSNPLLGTAYSLARALGFNPAYGLNNLFGNGLDGVAPGFTGTGYGFFGNNAIGSGIRSTPGNITNAGYSSSGSNGYSGYTPSGYESGDLGSGITNTSNGYGVSGGISTPSYSWGSSGYSSNNDSSSSYSSSGYPSSGSWSSYSSGSAYSSNSDSSSSDGGW